MTKEQIEEAYKIALKDYQMIGSYGGYEGFIPRAVQVGIQMALNNEVLFKEDGTVKRIE